MNFKEFEVKWQREWEKTGIFKAKPRGKKYYVLEMFPYPSGKLHMGHVRNYSIGDAYARFKRMLGYNVLYPMGYDALGLPAENAAIKHNACPKEWTYERIKEMREQQKRLGFSYDWSREIRTCDPDYYKWNQWIFLQFFKRGLVYRKKAPVNWCPSCQTVLANEQVIEGKCWRCKTKVTQKELEQWFINIRKYANELLKGLEKLKGWPERVKIMQENWIGKSEGAEIEFKIEGSNKSIKIFTTRPDTIYGVTFMVFAPEHPMVRELVKGTEYESKVEEFIERVRAESLAERTDESKPKEGMFIGRYAINPVNGERVPIYIGDFVIYEYGGGAVMAVPAHDQRDFEFAKKHGIEIKVVIRPGDKELKAEEMERAYVDDGIMVNSGKFNGMHNREAMKKIVEYLEELGVGKAKVEYKLRDWLISRQRYWGTPIPIIYCEKCGVVPVKEEDLPVLLPDDVKFTGKGNPLQTSKTFLNVSCPKCGGKARRETDTMDTFFDSSWYFFRYCSPNTSNAPFDKEAVEYWCPVDQYIGGIEHATMHLIYARFFTKALRDLGLVSIDEPFTNLLTQGMVIKDGAKMSKSLGNVVDPGEMIEKYGADTVRLFILFASSPEKELEWSDKGIEGMHRFVRRFYNLVTKTKEIACSSNGFECKDIECKIMNYYINKTIKETTCAIKEFKFNLAISMLMEFFDHISEFSKIANKDQNHRNLYGYAVRSFLLLISPFAPHTAEELWHAIGNNTFISIEKWPSYDDKAIDKSIVDAIRFIENLTKDVDAVLKLSRIEKPREIRIYVAEDWKYSMVKRIKSIGSKNIGEVMKALMQDEEFRRYADFIKKNIPRLMKGEIPYIEKDMEIACLNHMKDKLIERLGIDVKIVDAERERGEKATKAMPAKPGIEVI